MNSENVKDKDSKVEYLTKIIDCLSLATGQSLQIKPGKLSSCQMPSLKSYFILRENCERTGGRQDK